MPVRNHQESSSTPVRTGVVLKTLRPASWLDRAQLSCDARRSQGPVLQPEPRLRIKGAVRQKLARLRQHRQRRAAMTRFGRWPPRECGHKFGQPAYDMRPKSLDTRHQSFGLRPSICKSPRPERGHVGGGPKGRNSGAIPGAGGRIINRKIVDANGGRCSDAPAAEICLRRSS
jgi:hypothetical protein